MSGIVVIAFTVINYHTLSYCFREIKSHNYRAFVFNITTCTFLYTGILLLCVQCSAQNEPCSFGANEINNQFVPYTIPGQYLDLNNTAPCSGNLTAIQYCFHSAINTSHSFNESTTFSVHIWREENDTYTKIHEIMINTSINQSENINSSNTLCMSEVITQDEPLQVLAGDVLGIYFENPSLSLLATSSTRSPAQVTGVSEQAADGLYYDTRPWSEVREESTLRQEDLAFNAQLTHYVKVQIGKAVIQGNAQS